MNFGIKARLITLGLAVTFIGTLIVFITLNSQRQVSELQSRLNDLGTESSGIMDEFEVALRKLNSAVLAYGTDHDPMVWQDSLEVSHHLETWIADQKNVLQTPLESDLLQRIQVAYSDYVQVLWDFHAKVKSLDGKSASLADFTPVREKSHQMFELGQALARAHYRLHNEFLQHANLSLEHLHFSVLVLLILLFVLGTIMAVGVYKNLVAPLRNELTQTLELIGLHEKLASLGLIASDIAHEVRSPLTSIKISLAYHKKKFQPGSTERADAEIVEREMKRLENVLDDLLTITRPGPPQLKKLNLKSFLHELRIFIRPQLTGLNVKLVTDILSPMHVRADAAQLKQAIISLVQSAAGSLGYDRCLTLRARPDKKPLAGVETDVAILEVMDMTKADSSQKEVSIQSNKTVKRDGFGTGLTTATLIVQNHGGELQFQSQMNCSAIFSIVLPRL